MFTHELRDSVLYVTFRRTVQNLVTTELNDLARAAVNGSEQALDTLTNWRPRTAARGLTHAGVTDNQCFYVGCQTAAVFYVNQSGACKEVLRPDGATIMQMLWHPKREVVVTLDEDMMVGYYMVESQGTLTELERVKLSGKVPGKNGTISWAGSALAVITGTDKIAQGAPVPLFRLTSPLRLWLSGDFSVRIYDLDTSDSFLLPMKQPGAAEDEAKKDKVEDDAKSQTAHRSSFDSGDDVIETDSTKLTVTTTATTPTTLEVFSCLAYCSENQTLCAGTSQGNLYMWKRNSSALAAKQQESGFDSAESYWQLCNVSNVRGTIKHCSWGVCDVSTPCVLLNCVWNVYILKVSIHLRTFEFIEA